MRTFLAFIALVFVLAPAGSAAAEDGTGRAAFGPITALTATSLTVQPEHDAALTCSVPPEKQSAFAQLRLAVGQRIGIRCVRSNDGYVLAQIATTPPPRERAVDGVVASLSSDAITIKPARGEALTCALGSVPVDGVSVGARVSALCRFDGGRYVLEKLRRLGDRGRPPVVVRSVNGTLAALTAEFLAVTGSGEPLVCGIPPQQRAGVAALGLAVGDSVAVSCRRDGNRWILVAVQRA